MQGHAKFFHDDGVVVLLVVTAFLMVGVGRELMGKQDIMLAMMLSRPGL